MVMLKVVHCGKCRDDDECDPLLVLPKDKNTPNVSVMHILP